MSPVTSGTPCAAHGCTATKPAHLLMCAYHWRMVAPARQEMVHRTNSDWKDGGSAQAWLIAREMARIDVAEHTHMSDALIQLMLAEVTRLSEVCQ